MSTAAKSFDLSRPVPGISDTQWAGLGAEDRRWHHERQDIIRRRRDGERVWLSGAQLRHYGLTAADLAPGGKPGRVPAASTPAGNTLAGDTTAPRSLADITNQLDTLEDDLSRLSPDMEHAWAAYTAAMEAANNPDLKDSVRRDLARQHTEAVQRDETATERAARRTLREARAIDAEIRQVMPAPIIPDELASHAAAQLEIVRPELALMSDEELARRLETVGRQRDARTLAHLTVGRERLAARAGERPTVPADIDAALAQAATGSTSGRLREAVEHLAGVFADTTMTAPALAQADRIMAEALRITGSIDRARAERGEVPAWLAGAL